LRYNWRARILSSGPDDWAAREMRSGSDEGLDRLFIPFAIIFPERMALEFFVEIDAAQIRMFAENDPV
jgi:hypothetical protein